MWDVITTPEFDEWFATLDDEAFEVIIAKMDLLRDYGPTLKRPHADTLAGSKYDNLKELRADTSCQRIRIAFAFDPVRRGVLLVGGDKQGVGQKVFYKQLIRIAERLYARHLESIRRTPS